MTSNNISVDYSYTLKNVCRQRQGIQLFNVPSTRLNLQKSPYDQYTKYQLDMRRKVEILKFSSNRMNSQTNNLTKSQKWANLVSGITTSVSSSSISNAKECTPQPSLSSSCDIPGPVFQLYEDPTVPLYNFKQNTNSYSIYPDAPLLKWSTQVNNNVYIKTNTDETLNKIITRIPSDSLKYIYTINVPLELYFNANITKTSLEDNLKLSINKIQLRVYYNNDIILTYDVTSQIPNYIYTALIPEEIDVYYSNFTVNAFLGNISYNNIILSNENQYIYDIKLYVDYSLLSDTGVTTITESSIIANYVNVTNQNLIVISEYKMNVNCNETIKEYKPFSFTENI